MNMKEICGGVKLFTHKTSQFKTAGVSLNIITPLDEGASAKALLINLLARTNALYPTINAMNRKLSGLYDAVISPRIGKIGEAHVLTLALTCLDDRFSLKGESIVGEGISLLLSCLFEPDTEKGAFKKENLEREKRLLKEQIDSENDDKRLYALQRLTEEMCDKESYRIHHLGSKEYIDSITGAEIYSLWESLLKHSQFQIDVIGNFDEDKTEAMLREKFADIERSAITPAVTEFIPRAEKSKTVEETQKVQQSKLVIGLRAGTTSAEDNYAAAIIMTSIFGGGTFSKLFTNVREKMSLCYYCSAGLIQNKGIITVQSGVETENLQKALDAILGELEDMKKGNFTEEDIAAAKMSFADSMRSVTDSIGRIRYFSLGQCTAEKFITPEEYIAMTEKITYDEIIAAAKNVTLDTVYILKGEKEEQE